MSCQFFYLRDLRELRDLRDPRDLREPPLRDLRDPPRLPCLALKAAALAFKSAGTSAPGKILNTLPPQLAQVPLTTGVPRLFNS